MVGLLGPARGPARLRSAPRARGAAAGDLPGARPAPRRFTSRASWARLRSPVPSPRPPCRRPSSLRSASARRRRRGLTRRAARAPPLRSSGPVGPAWIPRIPSHYLSPVGERGPLSASGALSSTYASIYVRAARSGPSLRSPTFGCDHLKGGRALPPGHYLSPVGGRGSLPAGGVLSSADASIYARAGRSGPLLRLPTLGGVHLRGGRATSLRHFPLHWVGGTGGDVVRSWEAPGRPGAEGWRRGDVRSLPVTTSHQWGDVLPPGGRCALLGLRGDLRARGPVGPTTTSADARRCSPQGGTRDLSPSLPPPLGGGDGGGRGPLLGSTVPARR